MLLQTDYSDYNQENNMNVLWDGKKKMWIGVIYKYLFSKNAFERDLTNKINSSFSFEHAKNHHIILGGGLEEERLLLAQGAEGIIKRNEELLQMKKKGFIPLPSFMMDIPKLTEPVCDLNYGNYPINTATNNNHNININSSNLNQAYERTRMWSGSAPSSPPPPLYSESSMIY